MQTCSLHCSVHARLPPSGHQPAAVTEGGHAAQTNILFLENVLRHPEFLSGQATTSFIDRHPQLFNFNSRGSPQSSLVLTYLADVVRCLAGRAHSIILPTAVAMCVCGAVCAHPHTAYQVLYLVSCLLSFQRCPSSCASRTYEGAWRASAALGAHSLCGECGHPNSLTVQADITLFVFEYL